MTLLYLIVGSVVAALFILALHHAFGRSTLPGLAGRDQALTLFRALLPDEPSTGAALSRDGFCALIEMGGADRFGLLIPMGQHWATRIVGPGGIRRWSLNDDILTLMLADFTAPAFRLVFADPAEASLWRRRLEALPARG